MKETAVVATPSGRLRGKRDSALSTFGGIPYAVPPVGELRFAAPRPCEPWAETRDATHPARPSVQPRFTDTGSVELQGPLAGSEDCLYLNVTAPAEPGRYPVLVWIHGGGGMYGDPASFNAQRFASHGVVVVSVGYRLGVLGLLYLPGVFSGEPAGNLALLDQIAAIRWVRTNIQSFYGDPDRITIFGQSNGGRSVINLLGSPLTKGLFQQAIIMSATGGGYLVATPSDAIETTNAVLAKLGLSLGTAAKLRSVSAGDIVRAQTVHCLESGLLLPFQCVLEPENLPRLPVEAIRDGCADGVRLVIGSTHDEADFLAPASQPDAPAFSTRHSVIISDNQLARARGAYERLLPDSWSADEIARHALTSSDWWIPAIRIAESHAASGGHVWMYRTDWRLYPRGKGIGSPHGIEATLLQLPDPRHEATLRESGASLAMYNAVLEEIEQRFIEFVSTGMPASADRWPAYDATERQTYIFDTPSSLTADPDQELRMAWPDIIRVP